jgi:hypothetical protein
LPDKKKDDPPDITTICERIARLEVKVNGLLWIEALQISIVGAILLKVVFHIG